jgi:hypothetical protein
MITRRSFLTATAAFLAAPAIIRVADLMPVKAYPHVMNVHHTIMTEGDFVSFWSAEMKKVPWDLFYKRGFQGSAAWRLKQQAEALAKRHGSVLVNIHTTAVPPRLMPWNDGHGPQWRA